VIASVHICDSNPLRNLTRSIPKPASVPGLRWSHRALCGEPSPGARPDVQLGRGGLVAWWDDDDALDRFLAQDPKAAPLREGWSVRLRPTRTRATWPNADFDPFPQENERHDGVHAAITLGTAHLPTFPRFLKASSLLEEQFIADENGIWGLAMTLPQRIVMTLTFWEDQDATDAYTRSGAHEEAMKRHYDFPTDTHEFVSEGGFFGFQPYALTGRLVGKNATPARLTG
jgi:heme-degrading monooxygenase HmoA